MAEIGRRSFLNLLGAVAAAASTVDVAALVPVPASAPDVQGSSVDVKLSRC